MPTHFGPDHEVSVEALFVCLTQLVEIVGQGPGDVSSGIVACGNGRTRDDVVDLMGACCVTGE